VRERERERERAVNRISRFLQKNKMKNKNVRSIKIEAEQNYFSKDKKTGIKLSRGQ
jgi:hypothetical protein